MVLRAKEILGFNDKHFMIVGILLVSLMMNLLLFGDFLKSGQYQKFATCIPMAIAYTTFFWLIFRQAFLEVTKRYSGYENIRARYMIMVPTVVLLFLFLKFFLDFTVDPVIQNLVFSYEEPNGIIEFLASFVFTILIISIYEGAHLFVELQESQLEKEQLVKANISSQLEGLKNQVNPHFLFNSLNTLASIIPEDEEKSIRFVSKLSKVYRYILDITDKKLVTLTEEFKFLNSYNFLLKERFGDNIKIKIDVPEESLKKYIVPLSLQITFENAIKHNIISKKMPLEIEVYLKRDKYLVIKNNLQKKKTIGVSPGLGLLNIKNRYNFFTHKEVKVLETENAFEVMLPLLLSTKIVD